MSSVFNGDKNASLAGFLVPTRLLVPSQPVETPKVQESPFGQETETVLPYEARAPDDQTRGKDVNE